MKPRSFKLSKPIRTLFWCMIAVPAVYLCLWCGVFVLLGLEGPEPYWSWKLALMLNPYSANSHFQMGEGMRKSSDMSDCVECTRSALPEYRKAIRLKPDFAEAHYRYGCALADVGNEAEAKTEFAAALRLNPNLQSNSCAP